MPEAVNALLCWRLTTETGTILELWELDNGDFELLTAEAHQRDEVTGAVTLTLVECELLAEKLGLATDPVRHETLQRERDGYLKALEALAEGRVDFEQWRFVYLAAKAQNQEHDPAKEPA